VEVYNVEYAYGGNIIASKISYHHISADSGSCYGNPSSMISIWIVSWFAGHEYDMSGVFATNPRDAPGPGND